MKNIISLHNCRTLLAMTVLLSVFLLAGASQARAHNDDRNGYRDRGGNYHRYGYHHHHRGYWNQHNGVRFWINI